MIWTSSASYDAKLPLCLAERNLLSPETRPRRRGGDKRDFVEAMPPDGWRSQGIAMVAVNLVGSDEERFGRQLTSQAEIILSGRRGDVPPGFSAALFGRGALEDLLHYEPKELAA